MLIILLKRKLATFKFIYSVHTQVGAQVHVCHNIRVGSEGNLGRQFFPSIMCAPEIKSRLLGSAASVVTHGAVSLAVRYYFK